MSKISIDREKINHHLIPILKGSPSNGYYLKNTKFFQRLIEYSEEKIIERKNYDNINNLYSFQTSALRQLVQTNNLLINLSPGLGKTYVISTLIAISPIKNILIIAPKSLHYIWKYHIENVAKKECSIRSFKYDGGIEITNIEQIREDIIDFNCLPTFLVIDESICIKNRKSKNFLSVKSRFSDVPFKALLSGSPYSKDISDLWSQLNFLFPSDFTSYWDFVKIFCILTVDQYGWKINGNKPNIEHMLQYALQDYIYSAHIDDVIDLPDYTDYIINIPPTEDQIIGYESLRKDFIYREIEVIGPLALTTRLKQLSLSPLLFFGESYDPKTEYLLDLLNDIELPAIIISSSNKYLYHLQKQLNIKSTIFNADNPEGYKPYLENNIPVMLMQIASGKFGHSFINTRSLIYVDYTFNSDDFYQSKARVKRLTSEHPVSIYYLHCLPIDSAMYKLNLQKNLSVDNLMKEVENGK